MTERKSGLGDWHGSASDRGSADRYYGRERSPHFWPDGTGKGTMVAEADMTEEEKAAYIVAWRTEEDRKDHGQPDPPPEREERP